MQVQFVLGLKGHELGHFMEHLGEFATVFPEPFQSFFLVIFANKTQMASLHFYLKSSHFEKLYLEIEDTFGLTQ